MLARFVKPPARVLRGVQHQVPPAVLEVRGLARGRCRRASRVEGLRTGLHGWSWGSFCKTQYASDPKCGGTANFVRCHLAVVHLLDAIQKRQLATVEVSDEGDYWEHRDAQKLAKTVGDWNQMVATVVGQFKDMSGDGAIEAPITEFPDFEHLEAKGLDKLGK